MDKPASTVNIVFRSPARTTLPRTSSHHRRNLEGVPPATAQEMAADFAAYQHRPSAQEEKKLYEYQPHQDNAPGEEVFVALDFEEIVDLEVGT